MAQVIGHARKSSTDRPSPRRLTGIALIVVALAATACDASSSASPSGASGTAAASGPAATPVAADTSSLVIAVPGLGRQDFTPWLVQDDVRQVTQMIGDQLVRVSPETGELEGVLAESWELSPDGTTWDFKLRPDVPFHDDWGTVTADDVKFTFEQSQRSDSVLRVTPTIAQAIDGDMANFEIVKPLEFKLHSTKQLVTLPASLTDVATGIVIQSKKYWDAHPNDAATHPIGTGSFKFVSSEPDTEVKLQAVQNHWRKTSTYENITIKIISDEAARLAQVQSGAVDFAPVSPQLVGEAKAAGLQLLSIPDAGAFGVILGGIYPDSEFNDPTAPWIQADHPERGLAIREALSLAIDRQTILDRLLNGDGTLMPAPITAFPGNPLTIDPSWTVPAYDVAQARQKLADGGYPDGFEITVQEHNQGGQTVQADIGEAVAGMWEAIGIKVKRTKLDFVVFKESIDARKIAGIAFVQNWGAGREPAEAFNAYRPEGGTAFFYDSAINEAYPTLQSEPDHEKRFALGRHVTDHLRSNMTAIPLFTYNTPFVIRDGIGGWKPNANLPYINALETLVPQ